MAIEHNLESNPMGHTTLGPHSPRRTLSPGVARLLADVHAQSRASYRTVAAALNIDYGYWRRLTLGERAPSVHIAHRIIDLFGFDDQEADQLLAESVVKSDRR